MNVKYFEVNGTIKKDVTAFGNKYWIQVEDDVLGKDNSELEEVLNGNGKIIVAIEDKK